MLYGLGVENLGKKENQDILFNKFCAETGINPIYEYRQLETNAERERHSNTTYGVYHFNDPDGFTTIRIDITKAIKPVPEHLKGLRSNGSRPKCLVDIELFEKNPLQIDSKNKKLKEFIEEYTINGKFTFEELQELGCLMTLQDLEKIHTTFLIFDNNSYVLAFLGLGNNQPYTISEKNAGIGKNRFYRYSLIDGLEQTSNAVAKGERLQFKDGDVIFSDFASDGKEYGLFSDLGVIVKDGAHLKKATIKIYQNEITPDDELKKRIGLPFLSDKLKNMFPQFSAYEKVFYDPLERVNSYGHKRAIELLIRKGILGAGWQSRVNVASDLYIHGHNDAYRIKPITLLLYHLIEIGEFEKIIVATADGTDISALQNCHTC